MDISTLSLIEHAAARKRCESLALTSPFSVVSMPASVRWPHPDRAAQDPQAELLIVSTQTPASSIATTRPDSIISTINATLRLT